MADKKMITKDDLAQRIAAEVRLTKGDATKAVEVLFAATYLGHREHAESRFLRKYSFLTYLVNFIIISCESVAKPADLF